MSYATTAKSLCYPRHLQYIIQLRNNGFRSQKLHQVTGSLREAGVGGMGWMGGWRSGGRCGLCCRINAAIVCSRRLQPEVNVCLCRCTVRGGMLSSVGRGHCKRRILRLSSGVSTEGGTTSVSGVRLQIQPIDAPTNSTSGEVSGTSVRQNRKILDSARRLQPGCVCFLACVAK